MVEVRAMSDEPAKMWGAWKSELERENRKLAKLAADVTELMQRPGFDLEIIRLSNELASYAARIGANARILERLRSLESGEQLFGT
jgi:hypothetical protein